MTLNSITKFALWAGFLCAVTASPLSAQSSTSPAVQIRAFSAGRYEPGEWAGVGIEAVNATETDAEGLLALYFDKDAQSQFARRLWVPARSARRTWLPVRLPRRVDIKRDSIEMTMLLLRQTPQGEVMEFKDTFDMRRTALLPVDRERIKMAAIFGRPAMDKQGHVLDMDEDAYDVAAAAKKLAGYSPVLVQFRDELIPPHDLMWQNFDEVVLCSDRIQDDSAGLAAARDWLRRGGRMMVFLDRVSIDTVAALVGHALCFQVVDRVELDDFVIDAIQSPDGTEPRDLRNFEEPVPLLRVTVNKAAHVTTRVQGWPVAFSQPVGSGEILFLALGARGWLPAPIPPSEAARPEHVDAEYRQTRVLRALADRFFRIQEPRLVSATDLGSILQERIGYRIPQRSLAASLLGLNVILLVGAGLWCARADCLDRLIWILPAGVLVTTAMFLVIGQQHSRSVPSTAAFTQFVEIFPETGEATVTGQAALYQQTTTPLTMALEPGGFISPAVESAPGTVTRLIWGDDDRGRWENLQLPGGSVQFVRFQQPLQLRSQIEAVASFGPQGLAGRVLAPSLTEIADAVVANPPALPLAIQLRPDGTFVAGQNAVLPVGRYVAETVLSDDARRHQDSYRQLLNPVDDISFPSRPSLLGWSPHTTEFDWPGDSRQTGSAMVAIPLKLQRTAPKSPFEIPSTFIQTELTSGKSGQSMTFNPRTGEWIKGVALASQSRLRFALPSQVLPCQLSQAVLTIKLNAPSRTLQVHTVNKGQDQLFEQVANPNGVHKFEFNRPEQLALDDQGGLLVVVTVTEAQQEREAREANLGLIERDTKRETKVDNPTSSGSFTTWQIDYVRLDVRGTTQ